MIQLQVEGGFHRGCTYKALSWMSVKKSHTLNFYTKFIWRMSKVQQWGSLHYVCPENSRLAKRKFAEYMSWGESLKFCNAPVCSGASQLKRDTAIYWSALFSSLHYFSDIVSFTLVHLKNWSRWDLLPPCFDHLSYVQIIMWYNILSSVTCIPYTLTAKKV